MLLDTPSIAQTYPLPSDIMKPFIDWLSFSLPYSKLNFAWIVENFGARKDLEKGFMGYSDSFQTDFGARVGHTPSKPENKIHIVLSGKVLAGLRGKIEISQLIEQIINLEGKFSRIDLALDDFEGFLDFETIWGKLERKEVSTRFKTYSWIQSKKQGSPSDFSRIESGSLWKDKSRPIKSGDTIYIGNRSSDVFCRIYDKIKETKSNHIEVHGKTYFLPCWNRLEFELKHDAADQYCNPHDFTDEEGNIVNKKVGKKTRKSSFLDRSFPDTAFYYLKFIEPSYKFKKNDDGILEEITKHKRHWTVSDWWIDFLKTSEGKKIGLSFVRPGLEGVRDWTLGQTSGAFFALKEIFGDQFLTVMEKIGSEKFSENERYQKLVNEFKNRETENIRDLTKALFFKDYIKEKGSNENAIRIK